MVTMPAACARAPNVMVPPVDKVSVSMDVTFNQTESPALPAVIVKISVPSPPVIVSSRSRFPTITMVSFSVPPSTESFPEPAVIVSLSAAPEITSFPVSPPNVSEPAPPVIVSLPTPPAIMSAPASPLRTSLPEFPLIVSPPEPPVIVSAPEAPSKLSLPAPPVMLNVKPVEARPLVIIKESLTSVMTEPSIVTELTPTVPDVTVIAAITTLTVCAVPVVVPVVPSASYTTICSMSVTLEKSIETVAEPRLLSMRITSVPAFPSSVSSWLNAKSPENTNTSLPAPKATESADCEAASL